MSATIMIKESLLCINFQSSSKFVLDFISFLEKHGDGNEYKLIIDSEIDFSASM